MTHMGVRLRVIATVALVVALLAVGMFAIGGVFVARTLEQRERIEVEATLSRAREAFAISADHLSRNAKDWATWDDTYDFVQTKNPQYIESNLSGKALEALEVDMMVFIDRSDTVVHAIAADSANGDIRGISPGARAYLSSGPELVAATRRGEGVSGVIASSEGPLLLSAQPVLKSDGSGPVVGTFVIGTYVRASQLSAINRLTGETVAIRAVDDPRVSGVVRTLEAGHSSVIAPIDGKTVRGFTLLQGIEGEPALLMAITQPRASVILVQQSRTWAMLASLLAAVGVILTVSMVVDHLVLRRLAGLSASVNAITDQGEPGARVEFTGTDEIASLAGVINKMLEAVHSSEQEIRYLADHDALTGLGNRRQFERDLDRELSEARRLGSSVAILWFDLDSFKDINDSYGHAAGDQLLCALAVALRAETRDYTTIARIGGDEFALILPHADESEAMMAAERLVGVIHNHVFDVSGHDLQVRLSAGVALYPDHGTAASDLLVCADLAMYQAKAVGGARISLYSPGVQDELTQRMRWAERISAALRDGRFVLHTQPISKLDDSCNDFYELLIRMVNEDGTLTGPSEFIPFAERSALISRIDRWVAAAAIDMLRAEKAAGRETSYAVNISAAGMTDNKLAELIMSGLASSGVDPSRLVIEITEAAATSDIAAARHFIDELKAVGCRFALDDFGSGMASIHYLKYLSVDFLKVDGSLIRGLRKEDHDIHFLNAIMEMSKGLRVRTVAEHVEDADLLSLVERAGFDFAQGYCLGRPRPCGEPETLTPRQSA